MLAALFGLLAESAAFAQVQSPRFPGGFPRPAQTAQPNPEESSAYRAALAQQNPADRVTALQQFLSSYPGSSLRQSAISGLMAAQRQLQTGQDAPALPVRGSAPQPAAAAPPAAAPLPPAQAAGPQRDSLLQQTAKQAEITIAERKLEIKADNSALSQILHEISGSTGMKVEGLSKDERIFGTYGPGNGRDVLLALLEGSGYNVVMVGELAAGTPRELSLTQQSVSVSANSGLAARRSTEEEADDEQEVQQSPPQPEPQPVQPTQANPPGQDPNQQPQPRTPQEIMQELQRLRQQQNQNQPQPQNPL